MGVLPDMQEEASMIAVATFVADALLDSFDRRC